MKIFINNDKNLKKPINRIFNKNKSFLQLKTCGKYSKYNKINILKIHSGFFSSKNDNDFKNDDFFGKLVKEFDLKTGKDIEFENFYDKMQENVNILLEANLKLRESNLEINSEIKEENLQHLQKAEEILKQKSQESSTNTTFDTMNELKDKVHANKGTFVMPLFWGWAGPFVKWGAAVLIASQHFTGIPWLPFFIASGVVVRMLIFPFMLRQMILIQRMAKVSPNIRLLSYCIIKCELPLRLKAYYYARSIIKYSKDVNVNLLSFAAYNLVQLPVFLLMVWSIRKIATEEDLTNKGILWFKNLNEADPYMILPIISVALTYFNLGRGINKDNEHWFINRWRSFFQILQIFYLPFTCLWPVGSHIYWITSSLVANLQNYVSRHPVIMSRINPTFYIDMQKVFQSERNKADSERYVEKLRNCEDPIIKSPTNDSNVLYEMDYEKTKMISLQKTLKYKSKIRRYNEKLIRKIKEPFTNWVR